MLFISGISDAYSGKLITLMGNNILSSAQAATYLSEYELWLRQQA